MKNVRVYWQIRHNMQTRKQMIKLMDDEAKHAVNKLR